MIIDLSDVLKCKQIQSLRVASRNRHYRNSQTIHSKWDERTFGCVRPLVFFFPCLEDVGVKKPRRLC